MPRRHQLARKKSVTRHTVAQKLHLRRLKRKIGPSAQRRAARRLKAKE